MPRSWVFPTDLTPTQPNALVKTVSVPTFAEVRAAAAIRSEMWRHRRHIAARHRRHARLLYKAWFCGLGAGIALAVVGLALGFALAVCAIRAFS